MTEFQKMIQLLDTSWYLKNEIVPCLVGPPGIGKTAAVMAHAKKHNAKVTKIVASRCVPSETVGMTMPDHDNRSMTIYNSMQLGSLKDGDILFLDELLEADQFVLSTLLTVIESREMADGTPLPDIQIIAATNDTIPPEQLKGNIRQRFMFMNFKIDSLQTADYIYEKTGLQLDYETMSMLKSSGTGYNFMTPRSLTKLCLWINATPEDKLGDVESIINRIWDCNVGTKIKNARIKRDNSIDSPEKQVIKEVQKLIDNLSNCEIPADRFDNCTMSEMLEILQGLPDWDKIADQLSKIEIVEEKEGEAPIAF
jgi:hypothetical protein